MPAGTLSASNQTDAEVGRKLDILLSGTWVGTVKLQRKIGASTWIDTSDQWTTNGVFVVDAAVVGTYRLDWTRTSGDLTWGLYGETGI